MMEEMPVDESERRPHFLDLPPEIHEQIIRLCGVQEVLSLTRVNRFVHQVVQSKLRDILISACQNGRSRRL